MESRMLRNGHVRFGGRPAETHPAQARQGAAGRPYTEHRTTTEGKLYCCAIKDVFSNRIVGYSISDRMTAKLAVDAVRNAVARRGEVAGCILHADRGSQFRSRAMARELRRHDMVGSMGRVGAAGTTRPWRCSYRCQVGVGVLSRSRKM
jgi:transposase InsO family protein